MHIHPLSDEIDERLQLDRLARPKLDGVGAELDHPFNDAAAGFLVAEDVAEWVLGNHGYGVALEVVAELSGCDQNGIK